MIDYENLRLIVARGFRKYLKCPVIKDNQNAEPPNYPYVSYNITTLMSENRGTYGEYEDGKARKPVNTVMSITIQSDDYIESITLANKAREWLDYYGRVFLSDNNIVVQSVTAVTNRDNVITAEYEYKNGFDCFFSLMDVVDNPNNGEIESVEMGENFEERLKNRLDGVAGAFLYTATEGEDYSEDNEALDERLDGEM